MVFITALTLTLLFMISITIYELVKLNGMELEEIPLMYQVFRPAFYRNHIIIKVVSGVLLAYTGFFIMPLVFLGGVHVRNFCNNRTTNERLTNKGQ